MYRVSADIGGTFTDIVVEDSSKKNIKTIKVLSTPENPANAVFEGLNSNLNIKDINFIVHGTTVGLNAFLERKGSRVLLIMTKGKILWFNDKKGFGLAKSEDKEIFIHHSQIVTSSKNYKILYQDEEVEFESDFDLKE